MRPSTKWPEQGVGDRGRLLGDLLEHEVLVAALLGGRQIPVDSKLAVVRDVVAVEVGDPVAVGGDHYGLVLAEFDGIAGVLDECGDVGADEHLAVADTEHQRRGPTGGHDGARVVGVGEDQREMALQPRQHGEHGCDEIACGIAVVVLAGDEVHGDLGVGVAGELHAVGLEFLAQHRVVLDDAVVDDRDLARGVTVRMGVAVRRPAVGGPAGVADSGAARQRCRVGGGQRLLQVGQPACATADGQAPVAVEKRDARGVVAAVLHPPQRVDDDAAGVPRTDVADDSAHRHPGRETTIQLTLHNRLNAVDIVRFFTFAATKRKPHEPQRPAQARRGRRPVVVPAAVVVAHHAGGGGGGGPGIHGPGTPAVSPSAKPACKAGDGGAAFAVPAPIPRAATLDCSRDADPCCDVPQFLHVNSHLTSFTV